MFLAGELITDIFTLIHKMLKVLATCAFVLRLVCNNITSSFYLLWNFVIHRVAKPFYISIDSRKI